MSREKAGESRDQSFLLVRSGASRFALPISTVLRVIRDLQYFPIPGAQPCLLGLAQYAGEPLPVLDLHAVVEGQAADRRQLSTVIVSHRTHGNRSILGLAVAEILQVAEIENSEEVDDGAYGDGTETVEFEGQTARIVKVDHILGGESLESGATDG